MRFLCCVKVSRNGLEIGSGWAGIINADKPGIAADMARIKHRESDCAATGELISRVEVRSVPEEEVIGDY